MTPSSASGVARAARPVRVLHVVANRWWTGSADPALDLARALAARGHAVLFACIRGEALETRARAAGLPPAPTMSLERTAWPPALLRDGRSLRRLVEERELDVVHAHQSHDHWLAALALRGTRTRLVRTVHHRRAAHGDSLTRWLWRRTDAVVAVSEEIARRLHAAGVPGGRVARVGGAVDVERFRPGQSGAAIRAELGLGDRPLAGCIARLVPGRGHDVLLRAAVLLRERLPGLALLLVGRGEGRGAIEGLVRRLSLDSVVHFAGYRADDLPAVLAAMDCVVLLGAGSEESCRAVLEAMATARPVVAARVGAIGETVVDGETGVLVGAGDRPAPQEVADGLSRLLGDPARARAMGAEGRRRVEAAFTPAHRAAAIEAVYRRLLAEG